MLRFMMDHHERYRSKDHRWQESCQLNIPSGERLIAIDSDAIVVYHFTDRDRLGDFAIRSRSSRMRARTQRAHTIITKKRIDARWDVPWTRCRLFRNDVSKWRNIAYVC